MLRSSTSIILLLFLILKINYSYTGEVAMSDDDCYIGNILCEAKSSCITKKLNFVCSEDSEKGTVMSDPIAPDPDDNGIVIVNNYYTCCSNIPYLSA